MRVTVRATRSDAIRTASRACAAGATRDGLFDAFRMPASHPRTAPGQWDVGPPVRPHSHAHGIDPVADGAALLIVRIRHGRQDRERAPA